MDKKRSIIYMGTPEFAVAPLKKLIEYHFHIAAVVTVADKPSGRGLKVHASPIKQFAAEHQIPVLQPLKLSDPSFIEELSQYNASLFIVVAFRKLPQVIWSLPPLGCFNLHASLLPQYRGAAPINHAVINGEKVTGVTTFFINDQIDTGKIIMQEELPIGPNETAGEVHDRLMELGAELVVKTTRAIFNNDFVAKDQSPDIEISDKSDKPDDGDKASNIIHAMETDLKKAPKIFREDCRIDWTRNAGEIHNFIRGLSPYPGAYSILAADGNKELKVLKSALSQNTGNSKPGEIILEGERLFVQTSDKMIEILILQPSGKKVMSAAEFIRGNRGELRGFLV